MDIACIFADNLTIVAHNDVSAYYEAWRGFVATAEVQSVL